MLPQAQRPDSFARHWLLPAGLLAGIVLMDCYFPDGPNIAPICGFLALAFLAFTLPPSPMIFWAFAYSLAAIFAICHTGVFRRGALVLYMESAAVLLAAAVTVVFCFDRLKYAKKSEQFDLLVKEMPVPFILSDGNGDIVLMNKPAAQLLGMPAGEAEGNSYFSLVADAKRKGRAIQEYLEMFDSNSVREITMHLKPVSDPGIVLRGTVTRADGKLSRYLITVIDTPAAA